MPESTDGGSLLVTIPGVNKLSAELARHQSIRGFGGTSIAAGRAGGEHCVPVVGACHFSPRFLEIAIVVQSKGAVRGTALVAQARDYLADFWVRTSGVCSSPIFSRAL